MLWDPSKRVYGWGLVKNITLRVLKWGHKLRDCYSVSHLIAILEAVFWNDRYQQSGLARAYNYCVIISHLSYRVTCFHKVWSCFLHSSHVSWGTWTRGKLLHCRIQWSLNRQILSFLLPCDILFYCLCIFGLRRLTEMLTFLSHSASELSYGKSCVSQSRTFHHSADCNTWKMVAQRKKLQRRSMMHSWEITCSNIKMKHGA